MKPQTPAAQPKQNTAPTKKPSKQEWPVIGGKSVHPSKAARYLRRSTSSTSIVRTPR